MRMKILVLIGVILAVFSGCGDGDSIQSVDVVSISERGESLPDQPDGSLGESLRDSPPVTFDDESSKLVILLVNEVRAEQGRPPLLEHARLSEMAMSHSQQMAKKGFFDHHDPEWGGVEDRADLLGYSYSALGENIAAGMSDPEEVVSAWMSSPGHQENILEAAFTQIGVGYVHDPDSEYGSYWTLILGSP